MSEVGMAQTLDLNGILLSTVGEKIPCKLINLSDKGYLELYCPDPIAVHSRYQLLIHTPRIQAAVKITAVEPMNETYHIEAIPEEGVMPIQSKIIEHKMRGLIK
jgi:hypothetical protein